MTTTLMIAAALAGLPPLPEAVSSFGAAAAGGKVYAYGGHRGKAHHYSTESATGAFRRLDPAAATPAWEELPGGPPLQGLSLVAHAGKLYRVGGMQPRNKPGDKADNHSVATCARFDPTAGRWEPLPDLPAGRSSHDAAVVGDTLVVVGGWQMRGGDAKPDWHDTALTLDLTAATPAWKAVPQPFKRRALTLAALGGKVYVIGGMPEAHEAVRTVDVFDVAAGTWSSGPELPGPDNNGFTPGACAAGGRLYVSGADGVVVRLNEKADGWDKVGALERPRFVHRMVPLADGRVAALGGASKKGNVALTEVIAPK